MNPFPWLFGSSAFTISLSPFCLCLLNLIVVVSLPLFRASDDPEKTNTTYLDDSQPAQGEMWAPFIGALPSYV